MRKQFQYPETGHVDDQIVLANIVSQVGHTLHPGLQEPGDIEEEGGKEGGEKVGDHPQT